VLIFLDLETTGLEVSDKICSIALIDESKALYELINEGKKIPSEASSIHHITNEMIKDKSAFKVSKAFKYLQEHNNEEHTLVAHNIQFDLSMLKEAGFIWKGDIIDTLRVTKHIIAECELFNLQFLRYELRLYKDEVLLAEKYGIKDAIVAHNALGDAFVCFLLFMYLKEIVTEVEMKELSFKHVLLEKFGFGKYKGRYIQEICLNDSSYAMWLLNAAEIDEDIRYSINYYLQG